MNRFGIVILFLLITITVTAQKTPIMGWSSWNNFHVNIDEKMIREQADAMISSGLYDAGYRFINIDDGYFGGRDGQGHLQCNPQKFPSGMKALADYIHSKHLKAGLYSDGGSNTCGSMYDNDAFGVGVGLYGHIKDDCQLFFKTWGFDFIKVDWCGGEKLKLNEESTYLSIIREVKSIDTNIVFNICRWQFPGTWAITKADSWRMSGDIKETFESIISIVDQNADLYKYASAGHYNDMDMLQVGRGMTYEEDKAHFTMWCMMNSPLLAGNDLRHMSKETVEILTNKEVIALEQDAAFQQARRITKKGSIEVYMKPLANNMKAIAVLNRGESFSGKLTADELGLLKGTKLRDLWAHSAAGTMGKDRTFTLPKHSVIVLKTTN